MKKFFRFFQQPCLSISSMFFTFYLIKTSMFFALLVEAARQLWGEKSIILFSIKISLTNLFIVSIDAPLNGFLSVIMSWSVFKPTCLSRLMRYSQRHDIIHNFLSVYDLYSNLSKGLPFLECFNTSVGIKVTDRSFRTILDTLNNLTVLILWAPSSNNKIRTFCVSSLSHNELLPLFCSKYLNKILKSHTKLNFGFGGLKLNSPVMYLLINGCLFNEL